MLHVPAAVKFVVPKLSLPQTPVTKIFPVPFTAMAAPNTAAPATRAQAKAPELSYLARKKSPLLVVEKLVTPKST